MRYIKHDFFTVVYLITHTLMTAYFLFNQSKEFDSFGKRDSHQMRYALALLFFGRLNAVITNMYGLSKGESIPKMRSKSTMFSLYSKIFLWIMMFCVIGGTYFLKQSADNFEGHNLLSKIWINVELIGFIVEIPYWYFQVEVKAQ